MSLLASQSPAYFTNIPCGDGNNNGWGGDFGEWILVFLLASMFGWGGMGGFGMGGCGMMMPFMMPWMMMNGFGGWGNCGGGNCATQADVRAAVDQQTLISKIDQQTYGMADVYNGLSRDINGNFRTLDGAICNLGFQTQQGFNGVERSMAGLGAQLSGCCCDIERSIDANTNAGLLNTMNLQKQISDCCCENEKMNMQNRFDAQTNHCGTLQAIDKLGDRIIGYMANADTQRLRDENQALRLSASQAAQNAYLIGQLRPSPIPSYRVPNPYCCNNNPCDCNGGW